MGYSYKELWKISAPILASMMMENVVGFTDTVFIGRVGESELAAVGLGWLYFLAVFIIGVGFSMGAQILISRRNGEKKISIKNAQILNNNHINNNVSKANGIIKKIEIMRILKKEVKINILL